MSENLGVYIATKSAVSKATFTHSLWKPPPLKKKNGERDVCALQSLIVFWYTFA